MRNEKLMEKSNEAWKLADEARVRQLDLGPASCMPVLRSRTVSSCIQNDTVPSCEKHALIIIVISTVTCSALIKDHQRWLSS
jgi:hypothetical protein